MSFFQQRRLRKLAREALHHARHARAMTEDIAPPAKIEALDRAVERLKNVLTGGDMAAVTAAAETLGNSAAALHPRMPDAGIRENFEVLVVALAVAMAIRTYLVQPFRIPTGSMQPTLFGMQYALQEAPRWYDHFPFNVPGWALFGSGYIEVRAQVDGVVGPHTLPSSSPDMEFLTVNGVAHRVRTHLPIRVNPGQQVVRGQVLAGGRMTLGDFVLVNKIRYNFSRPRRGDIIVFETKDISYGNLTGSFYIKRLAGLPHEKITLSPPYLVADGKKITGPAPFRRMLEDTENYVGYQFASPNWPRPKLMEAGDVLELGGDEYLPFGDNTRQSLDGRYFGPIHGKALVGPAVLVYWPFSARWGVAK